MRILLAPDSFKESASAEAIAQAMARGIKRGNPQAECRLMPLSDGGEGLTQALVHATAGTLHNVETVDAIGRPITAQFGFLGNNRASCILHTAVVELASASGLERVSPADRNALSASTFGTGLLIRAAIDAGADRIVLGLGGSATTDGGTGLARALGFRFLDTAGHDIPLGGGSLVDLERIDDSEVPDFVKNVPIVLACDVTNPLTGSEGAAHVFAPQKGAQQTTGRRPQRLTPAMPTPRPPRVPATRRQARTSQVGVAKIQLTREKSARLDQAQQAVSYPLPMLFFRPTRGFVGRSWC